MSGAVSEITGQAAGRMEKTVSAFESELAKIRTGKASTGLIEGLEVDYHGAKMPLGQIAGLSAPDPQTVLIQPWDETVTGEIEKAINQSDLGLTPVRDGKAIRLSVPPLSGERRGELTKVAGRIAEDHRVSIRQARKDLNTRVKAMEKDSEMSKDESKKALDGIQGSTDKFIARINALLEKKEKEIAEI
ncbi:MAG: ribosome recycling factor [Candidatus Dadabacteria bacterium]|nr:ribosome recycling factor [Candidatus Dadabacteria bacterium]